jgi:hypothetical protein
MDRGEESTRALKLIPNTRSETFCVGQVTIHFVVRGLKTLKTDVDTFGKGSSFPRSWYNATHNTISVMKHFLIPREEGTHTSFQFYRILRTDCRLNDDN